MTTYRRKSLGKGLYEVRKETTVDGFVRTERIGKIQKFGSRYTAIVKGNRSIGRDTFNEAAADLDAVHTPKRVA